MVSSQRQLRGRIAAHSMHARNNPQIITQAARIAFLDRFLREADPDGILCPEERERRAGHLRRAYFLKLAYLSVKARQERAQRRNGGAK